MLDRLRGGGKTGVEDILVVDLTGDVVSLFKNAVDRGKSMPSASTPCILSACSIRVTYVLALPGAIGTPA